MDSRGCWQTVEQWLLASTVAYALQRRSSTSTHQLERVASGLMGDGFRTLEEPVADEEAHLLGLP
jgi:hypothetical protein